MIKTYFISVIVFLLFTSCLETPESVAPDQAKVMAISGILQNRNKSQKLTVARVGDVGSEYQNIKISGATVNLSNGINTYFYVENDSINGLYEIQTFQPESNTQYILNISHYDYYPLKAKTKYPKKSDFNILSEMQSSGNIIFHWNVIHNFYAYQVTVSKWEYHYLSTNEKKWFWNITIPDELINTNNFNLSKESYILRDGSRTKIKIYISAIDRNYFTFMKFYNNYDPLDFRLIDFGNFSLVENGLGYFGSVYTDSLILENN